MSTMTIRNLRIRFEEERAKFLQNEERWLNRYAVDLRDRESWWWVKKSEQWLSDMLLIERAIVYAARDVIAAAQLHYIASSHQDEREGLKAAMLWKLKYGGAQ